MKLLTRTSLSISLVTLIIFGVSGLFSFRMMKNSIIEEADKDLLQESVLLNELLDKFPGIVEIDHPTILINISPGADEVKAEPVFGDTLMLDPGANAMSMNRYVRFEQEINSEIFQVHILHPMVEDQTIMRKFLYFLLFVSLTLVGLILLSILLISHRIWKPFHHTLNEVSGFDLQQPPTTLPVSNIQEFQQLNESINKLTQKVHNDYQNLKEFFEESSHEMQTPLAVVQTKLDRLSQSSKLSTDEIESLDSAKRSIRKLTRIARQFLMIGKIENLQFGEGTEIDLKPILLHQLDNIEELAQLKSIELKAELLSPFVVRIPEYLAETLISNLLTNALQHNAPGGYIRVRIEAGVLEVTNSGKDIPLDTGKIFNRFVKDEDSGSTGLGLAIVKRICDTYGLQIAYQMHQGAHSFSITLA